MKCDEVQLLVRDVTRGGGDASTRERVNAHLASCVACRCLADVERELDELLERRLPQHSAPMALKRLLRARLAPLLAPPAPAQAHRWRNGMSIALAASIAAAVGIRQPWRTRTDPLLGEAIADHMRVISRDRPTDVESGGPHRVKPWFTGRLDFAVPSVYGGDDEYTLQGGAVGYYVDRKAAVLVYKRRLHTISMFVFRADGLDFPQTDRTFNGAQGTLRRERGFTALIWRSGDLGYALVSDLSSDELLRLATRVATTPPAAGQ